MLCARKPVPRLFSEPFGSVGRHMDIQAQALKAVLMFKATTTALALISSVLVSNTASADNPLDGILISDLRLLPYVEEELQGSWRVISFLNMESGLVEPVYEDVENVWVRFGSGDLSVSAGCNPIWGDVYANNGRVELIDGLFSTMRACPASDHEEEDRFLEIMPFDGHYFVIDDRLHLFNEGGQLQVTLLRYE